MSSLSNPTPYLVNSRYLYAKTQQPLTVRYIGCLPPGGTDTQIWVGVEYDDPANGKGHSGVFKGIQVFHSALPGAGAFLKYNPTAPRVLIEGPSLVSALEERYGSLVDDNKAVSSSSRAPEQGSDNVVLGSSNQAIVVEAPNLDGVRKRIGQLERRREIGFEGEWVTTLGGDDQTKAVFKQRLKNVNTLDLSRNLVATWGGMAEIVAHLEGLKTLILNHSRIQPLPESLPVADRQRLVAAFGRIVELHLGGCALTWKQAIDVAAVFPNLEVLFLNDNSLIRDLSVRPEQDVSSALSGIKSLSLDSCPLHNWEVIVSGLSALPSLESLNLSGIPLLDIAVLGGNAPFARLTRLTLSDTRVSTWESIDNLNSWTGGALKNLRIACFQEVQPVGENAPPLSHEDPPPLNTTDPHLMTGHANMDRPFLIARLPALEMLNGTPVNQCERADSELYYLHFIDKLEAVDPNIKLAKARYVELAKKYDQEKQKAPVGRTTTTLKSKMINVVIVPPTGPEFTLRLLPTSSVAMLKKRVARQLKVSDVRVWMLLDGRKGEEMDASSEVGMWTRDGDRLGIEVE